VLLNIQENYSLLDKNSLGVPAICDFFVRISTTQELSIAIEHAKSKNLSVFILSGGTNLVLGQHINGLVICIDIPGIEILDENNASVLVRVGAGENWHSFVTWSLQEGFFGLENLALIPGSCGAAPVQNIGAYGIEVCQFIEFVEYLDTETNETKRLLSADCDFGYRDSLFKRNLKDRAVITHIEFRLRKTASVDLGYPALFEYLEKNGLKHSPQNVYKAVCSVRDAKLPSPENIPNAGSFFKNPIIKRSEYQKLVIRYPDIPEYKVVSVNEADLLSKVPAAWLIDRLGFKGKGKDGVGVHDKQALVLINPGHRTGEHIVCFATEIADAVKKEFNIRLEIEPQRWCV